jgi:hypothetical protein
MLLEVGEVRFLYLGVWIVNMVKFDYFFKMNRMKIWSSPSFVSHDNIVKVF